MKKKKEKHRISTTAAIMWRIAALALGLWLAAVSYLTIIVAQDLYGQWEDHLWRFSSFDAFTGENATPGAEKYTMIRRMQTLDSFGFVFLDLPFYEDPTADDERIANPDLSYETAMVFFDGEGNVILDQGIYAHLTYMNEETWHAGGDEIDGFTYINVEQTPGDHGLANNWWHYNKPAYTFYDMVRLTGYFKDGEFILLKLSAFRDLDYPPIRNPEGLSFGELDKEGQLEWETYYDETTGTDRELVNIYTTSMYTYGVPSNPVTAGGETFDQIRDLVKADMADYLASGDHDLFREGPYASNSLWESILIHRGTYTDVEGNQRYYSAVIRCYPLPAAINRLWPVYLLTLLPVVVLVLLIRRRLRQDLADPLFQIMHWGQKDLAPLPDTLESWWWEPYELEQGYVRIQQAVHELKKENRQLETALEFAKNAEENRRQMISNITHELKTPLAIIHSYAEGLQADIAADKQEQYLKIILEESERMDAMVLEMLDLSRLEAGKVRLASDQFSLLGLTQSIFDRLEPLIQEKDLTLHYYLAEEFDITADESRIGQVITNFATNAIKYTPGGGSIYVQVYRFGGKNWFILENDCEPLSEEALSKIWDSFYRADPSRTTRGTGLGLAIAKTIIELHRGECHVQNTSTGVQFRFTLP